MKYGRTTALTFGDIIAYNATIEVNYGADGIACFTNQMLITPGAFSGGGDSGALVVANSESLVNRPVGLVFAGSSTVTAANPIGPVLELLGVTIDGDTSGAKKEKKPKHEKDKRDTECTLLDENCTFVPREQNEQYLRVKNGSGGAVVEEICAYSSSSSECEDSHSSFLYNSTYNWAAEINQDTEYGDVFLEEDVQYIIATSDPSNALYLYWEDGDMDLFADLTITSTSESFSNISGSGTADLAIVTALPSSVTVGTPRLVGNIVSISWQADWSGEPSYSFPDFMISTAAVRLKEGATTTTLATSVDQSNGSGSYNWVPSRTYSSVQIIVEDEKFGSTSLSTSFDIVAPALEADIVGPTTLVQGYPGTWYAEVDGGVTTYSYDWDYLYVCNEQSVAIIPTVETCCQWNQGGTGSSWQHSVSGIEYDLRIRLTVTDSDSPPVQDVAYTVVTITEDV